MQRQGGELPVAGCAGTLGRKLLQGLGRQLLVTGSKGSPEVKHSKSSEPTSKTSAFLLSKKYISSSKTVINRKHLFDFLCSKNLQMGDDSCFSLVNGIK